MSTVPIDQLHPNPANIRADLGDLTELAASIRAVGLLQPLVVTPRPRGGGWTVLDGHRRLAAAKLAGARALPCMAAMASDADQQVSLMLAAAMHKELDPIDLGEAFRALRNRGVTVAEIARRTGYSTATINARLLLTSLPDEARDMVRHGELTVTEATNLARTGTAMARARKPAWLTSSHPLAARVKALCMHRDVRAVVGSVGCGQCWEQVIREDATTPTESTGAQP